MNPPPPKANAWWWWPVRGSWLRAACTTALLLTLAFPPVPLGPLALVAFVPLLVLLETRLAPRSRSEAPLRRPLGKAFKYGYVGFLLWNILTTYWLALAGHGDPDIGKWIAGGGASLVAMLANPVLQSLPLVLYAFARRTLPRVWALAAFVAFWVAFEYLHFRWELTWSWLTLGHAFALLPRYVQYIEWTGVLGASAVILASNAVVAEVVLRIHEQRWVSRPQRLGLAALWFGPLLLWPFLTDPGRSIYQPTGTLNVRIVQPNIDPYRDKFRVAPQEQLRRFLTLINRPGVDSIDLVVLPETALPVPILEAELYNRPEARLLQSLPADVLVGLVSAQVYPGIRDPARAPLSAKCRGGDCYDTYNAAAFFRPDSAAQPVYRKAKLVPFVERIPFMETLSFLRTMEIDLGGGLGSYGLPDSLVLFSPRAGGAVGTAICYESIFGHYLRGHVLAGANVLAVITNDGWWANTSGYLQHAAFSRLRAIEFRRWVVRSANTGQSAFFRADGVREQPTNWWEEAVIDARIPLLTGQTLYATYGDWLGVLLLAAAVVALGAAVARRVGRRE